MKKNELVKFYMDFIMSDIKSFKQAMRHSIIWKINGIPNTLLSGTFYGQYKVEQYYEELLLPRMDIISNQPIEFKRNGDMINVKGMTHALVYETGKKFTTSFSDMLIVDSNKVIKFEREMDIIPVAEAFEFCPKCGMRICNDCLKQWIN